MTIKTPKEFFETILPERFNPNKAVGVACVIQMNITGDNGGDWNITIKDQKIEIKEGVHSSPAINVKMKDEDYLNLVNGKLSGEKAFMTGKLRFKGNISSAIRLRRLGIF